MLNLATFLKKTLNVPKFRILITASLLNLSWLYRWRANGKGGTTSGTYYICATPQENNAIQYLNRKLKDMVDLKPLGNYSIMTTQASQHLQIPNNSFDYIFLDPPFGYNLMYSELNFLWEAWLKVFTNNKSEAIENSVQDKDLEDYRDLMLDCFKEAFRVLKPGRWMTIEFSNTQAAVWNSIQSALQEAGFVVANVAALDKQQGSFKAVTTTTAVKQDLVISAYKPNGGLEARFERLADKRRRGLAIYQQPPQLPADRDRPEGCVANDSRARPAYFVRPAGGLLRPAYSPGAGFVAGVPGRLAATFPGAGRDVLFADSGGRIRP